METAREGFKRGMSRAKISTGMLKEASGRGAFSAL